MDSTVQDDEHSNTSRGVGSWMAYCESLGGDNTPKNSEMTGSIVNEHEISPIRDREVEDMDFVTISRGDKRNREANKEELWKTMVRKGKRFAKTSHNQDTLAKPVDITEVSITSAELLPKQFKLAKLLQEQNIKHISRIKYVNPYKVLVQFTDEDSAYNLIESPFFKEKGYKCQATYELAHTYGVIKDIDLDVTDDEILKNFQCDKNVTGVKRLKRRNHHNGKWEPSECIRICFAGTALPKYAYIFSTSTTVYPYTYPITQCSRCWRFGHTMKICPSIKIICPKCSGFHANCETTEYRCHNCSGRHMTLSRTCPLYKKEKRIRELMSEFNCSYKKALMIFVPPEPIPFNEEELITDNCRIIDKNEQVENPQEGSSSYANILKTQQPRKNTVNKNKEKRKTKKREGNSSFDTILESSSDGEQDIVKRQLKENTGNDHERSQDQLNLLEQLKQKIWDSKLSLELKIKECANIIFDWIKSTLMTYLAQFSFLSYVKSWITNPNLQESI